jgi:PBP1b-binding outer membrane lipoprotein LpoB
MKKHILILAGAALLVGCEHKETTVTNPTAEKKETTIINKEEPPAPETKTETKTETNINVNPSPSP